MMSVASQRPERAFFQMLYWALMCLGLLGMIVCIGQRAWVLFVVMAMGVLLLIYAAYVEPHWISIKRYREPLIRTPKQWIKIVFLSDLHAGLYKSAGYYDRVAKHVEKERPDLLLIGGDLVEQMATAIGDLSSFQRLRASFGNFIILGNHDYRDLPGHLRRVMQEWGYEDLTNAIRHLVVRGSVLIFG